MSNSSSAPVNVLRAEISTMVASREVPKKAEEAALIRTALAQNRLFRLLDEDARNAMVRLAELKEYKEGDVIVKQGERGDKLVVVDRSGTVRGYFDGTQSEAPKAVLTLLKTLQTEPFSLSLRTQNQNQNR
jgi:signal-transduction protein with cAMP-binding, CBS, and nucleotidyltransferase domain